MKFRFYLNQEYINFYKKTRIPDESFFQTILCNSQFKSKLKPAVMYTDWSDGIAPKVLELSDIKSFSNKVIGSYGVYKPFFARKFNDTSNGIIRYLDTNKT